MFHPIIFDSLGSYALDGIFSRFWPYISISSPHAKPYSLFSNGNQDVGVLVPSVRIYRQKRCSNQDNA